MSKYLVSGKYLKIFMENDLNVDAKHIWYLLKYLSLDAKKDNEQIFSGKYLKICMNLILTKFDKWNSNLLDDNVVDFFHFSVIDSEACMVGREYIEK